MNKIVRATLFIVALLLVFIVAIACSAEDGVKNPYTDMESGGTTVETVEVTRDVEVTVAGPEVEVTRIVEVEIEALEVEVTRVVEVEVTQVVTETVEVEVFVNSDAVVDEVKQVGGGEEVIINWEDSDAEMQVIGPVTDEQAANLVREGGSLTSDRFYCVSSDTGTVTFVWVPDEGDEEVLNYYAVPTGFIMCGLLPYAEDGAFELRISGVDYNVRHFNTWSEMFIYRDDMVALEAAYAKLLEWQEREQKPTWFLLIDDELFIEPAALPVLE